MAKLLAPETLLHGTPEALKRDPIGLLGRAQLGRGTSRALAYCRREGRRAAHMEAPTHAVF
jgi:hypothetical protein